MRKKILWIGSLLTVILAVGIYGIPNGWWGTLQTAGEVTPTPRAQVLVRQGQQAQETAASTMNIKTNKEILFGDFHVHTTFSWDAFFLSLPMLAGEGAHPPADACDFARFCSALDFWAITDHAEGLLPEQWQETRQSIRQCNEVGTSEEGQQDTVAFLGWEWTQVGNTPDNHYGHKNVILRDTQDANTPTRPIASTPQVAVRRESPFSFLQGVSLVLAAPGGSRPYYNDFMLFAKRRAEMKVCPSGVDVRALPEDCLEEATTPKDLFTKLDQWGFPSIVIPHGTTWGFYTPPGAKLDKQLTQGQNDPEKQILFEIYSGHGNSEEYRPWRAALIKNDDVTTAVCPSPYDSFLPSCWQAGEIIRARCLSNGNSKQACEARAVKARANYIESGLAGGRTVSGSTVDDWQDSGQCRDCFLPAFNYRPGGSAQYALAITNFDDPKNPKRFNFGFMGSSDNHKARPGTGYKEFARRPMVEGGGALSKGAVWDQELVRGEALDYSITTEHPNIKKLRGFQLLETERQASFFTTGGLMAVHAEGRDRDAIWKASQKREVYGTSGDRILLWFDIENSPEGKQPMGTQTAMKSTPRFTVTAVGAFEQKPGCPQSTVESLSSQRIESLCKGECYNPSDTRKIISYIDIIRIHPQQTKGEPLQNLIQDPWLRFPCEKDAKGCRVSFTDKDFAKTGRDTIYYARAVQEESPAVNGGNLRCQYDKQGNCVKVNACFADYRVDYDEDCLTNIQERAWSSPITVQYAPVQKTANLVK